jgi:eukaryotic-like serine/threonine-protein kinase
MQTADIQSDREPVQASFRSLGVGVGDLVDGKFRIQDLVGMGGMSLVLRALHVELEETVALKCLNPKWAHSRAVRERFSREARAAVKIKSDHVARVFDLRKLPGNIPYMVMELLCGEDLGKLLDRHELLGIEECVGILIQACAGLAEAHALGIVHRDVKPENLFIAQRSDGHSSIKLLDFGISKRLRTSGAEAELDQPHDLLGTPLYMSPEQVRMEYAIDQRTDIWSLGAVLYELLTMRPPFAGPSVNAVCTNILEYDPPAPTELCPDVPEALSRVVLRCLKREPSLRYPSVAELAVELLPFAHRGYQAQVDLIVHALHAARLTDLVPIGMSAAPPPVRYSLGKASDKPTLRDMPAVGQMLRQRAGGIER